MVQLEIRVKFLNMKEEERKSRLSSLSSIYSHLERTNCQGKDIIESAYLPLRGAIVGFVNWLPLLKTFVLF